MLVETIVNVGAIPKEVSAGAGYYSARAVEELCAVQSAPSSHRTRPATAGCRRQCPGAAHPAVCPPRTGCGGSYRPSGAGSVTPCGWRRWNRCSAKPSMCGVSRSSCCGAWRRSTGNGCSSAPATTCSSCSGSAAGSPDAVGLPESRWFNLCIGSTMSTRVA